MSKKEAIIAMSTDNNYFMPTVVTISSILKNSNLIRSIKYIFLFQVILNKLIKIA
ncbi:MAG: hypothetical protein LBD57_01910 [Endomicrobium sp.]|jgi:lipopolysaccharide biosynthesis glycosyltransferase|uniref:hypothetical protein n=1 Tax=Candidatus Endomicrobiellum cubanum TaxID=3242325 RepID=UPI00281EC7CD|nr:hypothetical protein [Endomicrobium sp.]